MIHHNIWSCKDVQDHSSLSITWRKRWICQLINHCVFHFETNFLITHIYLIEFIYFCHDRFNWPFPCWFNSIQAIPDHENSQLLIITQMDNMRHMNSIMLITGQLAKYWIVMILVCEWEVKQRLQSIDQVYDQVYCSPSSTADIQYYSNISTQIVFRNARDVLLFLLIE